MTGPEGTGYFCLIRFVESGPKMRRFFMLASAGMFAFAAQAVAEEASDEAAVVEPTQTLIVIAHDQVEGTIAIDAESLAIDITVSPQGRGEDILDDVSVSILLDKSPSRN